MKELLVKESATTSDLFEDVEWCGEDDLPEESRCKVCVCCVFIHKILLNSINVLQMICKTG